MVSRGMSSAEVIIELNEVSKLFGEQTAVSNLTMAIASGQIFGLVGPSGCGKTTTVRMLVGVLRPSEGRVCVLGSDPTQLSTTLRERSG